MSTTLFFFCESPLAKSTRAQRLRMMHFFHIHISRRVGKSKSRDHQASAAARCTPPIRLPSTRSPRASPSRCRNLPLLRDLRQPSSRRSRSEHSRPSLQSRHCCRYYPPFSSSRHYPLLLFLVLLAGMEKTGHATSQRDFRYAAAAPSGFADLTRPDRGSASSGGPTGGGLRAPPEVSKEEDRETMAGQGEQGNFLRRHSRREPTFSGRDTRDDEHQCKARLFFLKRILTERTCCKAKLSSPLCFCRRRRHNNIQLLRTYATKTACAQNTCGKLLPLDAGHPP